MKTRWMMIAVMVAVSGMAQAAFVTIGHAGNAADKANGNVYGDVAYTYRIAATEVTIAEFMASGAGNGNENYWNEADLGTSVGPSAPVSCVSLYEAMQYCNWLTSGNINNGAYQVITDEWGDYVGVGIDRALAITTYGTVYALPTDDEWYKAAYFKSDASGYSVFANGTDTSPTWGTASGWNYQNDVNYSYVNGSPNYTWTVGYGGVEQNGTYNMMGNVWEWMEDSSGVARGGSFFNSSSMRSSGRGTDDPATEDIGIGFRVVAIPEPTTGSLMALVGIVAFAMRRHLCS